MIKIRKAAERGITELSWLKSWHSFSFGDYYDPQNMAFRALRVLNEDMVSGGGGFAPHSHRDMEIITYILEGQLEHKDSLGQGSIIRAGDVQRMTAGTGITHSEYNASKSVAVHLLQIWILPDTPALKPGYEQKSLKVESGQGLNLVAAPEPADGAVRVHQDVRLYIGQISRGTKVRQQVDKGRALWIQVGDGAIAVDGITLLAGDGLAVSDLSTVEIESTSKSRLLVFDLA
jgi:redox-sensitive bicupin YhaK (pirin superfamily)